MAGGEYGSVNDFVNQVILLKFPMDLVPIDGLQPGPDPLVVFFESPRGKALLRKLIREEWGR